MASYCASCYHRIFLVEKIGEEGTWLHLHRVKVNSKWMRECTIECNYSTIINKDTIKCNCKKAIKLENQKQTTIRTQGFEAVEQAKVTS